jgi:zinc transport system substrate-binding protein
MRLCLLLLCLQSAALAAAPRVVTSITPVYEITAAIMAGAAEPGLIIDNDASTHHFAFKPSHMRMLQQADLVIWIDRHFEAGFSRVPEILPPATQQLELMPALGLEGGDGHIWYSPRLLLHSIEIISAALMLLDPVNQKLYQANAATLMQDIAVWRNETLQHWQNLQPRFITDHNFTGYFEQDIGIRAIATVHDQHHDHGGLKHLNRLDNLLRQFPAACLLTLQTTASPLARSLARKHGLNIISVTLEPISDSSAQPLILRRLTRLTAALQRCM